MTFTQELKSRLAKRLAMPVEEITPEFLDEYMEAHQEELKHLITNMGGSLSSIYLQHTPTDQTFLDRLHEDEDRFMEELERASG